MLKKFLLAFTLVFSLFTLAACSETDETIPYSLPENTYVYDPHNHLSKDTVDEITKLNEKWKKTDQQFTVAVLMIDHLNGKSIEEISNKTARDWKIGYSGTNNGVLVTVATKDRKYRIETSDNVATKITDNQTRIIRERAKDVLSDEDWDKGTLSMVKDLGDTFYGKKLEESKKDYTFIFLLGLLVFIIIFVSIISHLDDGYGSSSGSSGGFFSSGSSSGGGFSGGGFSGGGSSGGF